MALTKIQRLANSNPEILFWMRVDRGDETDVDRCWTWRLKLTNGYGRMKWYGRRTMAHRIAFELENGRPPDDLSVLHRCDNPQCVRPSHLFLGTIAENNADRDAKGRGDAWPPELKAKVVAAYRRGGETYRSVAGEFGINFKSVSTMLRKACAAGWS